MSTEAYAAKAAEMDAKADECFSVEVSRMDWHNFVRVLWWREANMSLYYSLLRIWLHFGSTEFSVSGVHRKSARPRTERVVQRDGSRACVDRGVSLFRGVDRSCENVDLLRAHAAGRKDETDSKHGTCAHDRQYRL